MSLVAAIRKDGVVYLGADTRTTSGDEIESCLSPTAHKVRRMGSCYLGAVGDVASLQLAKIHPEWLELGDAPLTKRYLVCEVVPKLYEIYLKAGRVEEPGGADEGVNSGCVLLVTDGERIFKINESLTVFEMGDFCAIGATEPMADAVFAKAKDTDTPRELLLRALRISAHFHESVGAPYLLVDTENNEIEIVEE